MSHRQILCYRPFQGGAEFFKLCALAEGRSDGRFNTLHGFISQH